MFWGSRDQVEIGSRVGYEHSRIKLLPTKLNYLMANAYPIFLKPRQAPLAVCQSMATTTEVLSSGYSILESHAQLMKTIETGHNRRRDLLSQLPVSCIAGVSLPDLPNRSPSPEVQTPSNVPKNMRDDYIEKERERQLRRTDLDKDKMAKVRRYRNYVPEEETIRNDYSQQCVDGGQWPQNWVLGAELERRFEEQVCMFNYFSYRTNDFIQISKTAASVGS